LAVLALILANFLAGAVSVAHSRNHDAAGSGVRAANIHVAVDLADGAVQSHAGFNHSADGDGLASDQVSKNLPSNNSDHAKKAAHSYCSIDCQLGGLLPNMRAADTGPLGVSFGKIIRVTSIAGKEAGGLERPPRTHSI
jgi:hypothetical protein